ncbi:MAG: gamma-glutamyl-gamma-aminobutyrate hydrolase family protein [Bacteroidales bacterium]|nr:gamma-glutamyl-gamma-aminobutyrate hydrolase family protein [Bacteroidales bacterium]
MKTLSFIPAALLAAGLLISACTSRQAPLIGITCSRSSTGSTLLPATYSDAIRKAGGVPVAIPTVPGEKAAAEVLAALDGIVFSGGEDVSPAWYGETVLNETVDIDHTRDRSDSLLAREALRTRKPVLAICRGSQLLNVLLGGSLYQDIPSQLPDNVGHRNTRHLIMVKDGLFLHEVMHSDTLTVNSMHHQAVKKAADGVSVAACAEDGIVEAWEAPGVWAVQFHPEKMLQGGETRWLALFKAWVRRCK